jgi:hypothetical protein
MEGALQEGGVGAIFASRFANILQYTNTFANTFTHTHNSLPPSLALSFSLGLTDSLTHTLPLARMLDLAADRLLFQARRRACLFSLPHAARQFAERRDVLLVLQNRLVLAFVTTGNWCRGSVTYTILQNLLCMDGFLRMTI